jgi:HTH-type transcriptional regulator, transcriptional repressor of NAD biosynthesis genes
MAGSDVRHRAGLVLGKFHPPTLGHCYLVDFARHFVDHLTVVVATLEREEIPGSLRVAWMREMFPAVRVVHLTDENPQYPREHPDFWRIWRESLRRVMPEGPDCVFASEDYGFRLAEELGARYVPVDHARAVMAVSGTAVREDPMGTWNFIPPVVRPHFARRVCVIGPESTGKTTLAERLARHYGTVVATEYARSLIDRHGGEVREDLLPLIVRGQAASEAALARCANRILICDSDAFTTTLYWQLYFGSCPEWVRQEAERRAYDLYLVTVPDTPFVADSQRNHPDRRQWFFDRCIEWVERRSARFVVIGGTWEARFDAACAAVDGLIAWRPSAAPVTP